MAGYDWDAFFAQPGTQPPSLVPTPKPPETPNTSAIDWDEFFKPPADPASPADPAQPAMIETPEPETDYIGRAMGFIKDTAYTYMGGAVRTPGTLAWGAEKLTAPDGPLSSAFPVMGLMREAGKLGTSLAVDQQAPDLTPEEHAQVVDRLDPFKVGSEALQDLSNQSAKWWNDRVSEGYRKDAEADIIVRGEDGKLHLGDDWNLTTIIAGAAASANEMMLTAGMSVGGTVMARSAIRAGFPTLIKAAEGGSVRAARVLKFADMVGGATAGGGSEAVLAAGAAGAATEQQVLGMSHDELMQSSPRYRAVYDSTQGESEAGRRQYATETIANEAGMSVARNVGIATFSLGAPMGAFFGRMGAKAFTKGAQDVFEKVEGKAAGRLVTGAVGEAAQETAQSGAEQLLTNIGIRDYANDKQDITEGVLNAAVKGGLVGGVLGGWTSAVLDSKGEKTPKVPKPPKPSPEMTARTDELLTQLEANGATMADVTKIFRWAGSKGVAGLAGGRTHMELNRALQHLSETGALPDVVQESVGDHVDDNGHLTEQAFEKDQKYYGFTDGVRFTPVKGGDAGAIITALRDDGANGYVMRDGSVLVPTTKQGVDSLRMVATRVQSATGAAFKPEALKRGEDNGSTNIRRGRGTPGNPPGESHAADTGNAEADADQADAGASAARPSAPPDEAVTAASVTGESNGEAVTEAAAPGAGRTAGSTGPVEAVPASPQLGRAANVAAQLADTDIPVSASGRVTVDSDTAPEVAQRAVDAAAHDAATSPDNDFTEPTEGQIRGGNFRKGKVRLAGVNISIESPRGSIRRSKPGQKKWSRKVKHHYGYIAGTRAPDGEPVDVYLGPRAHDTSAPVFVIQQKDPKTGEFDEPKVMQGFDSAGAAKDAYLSEFPKGWNGYDGITEFTNEQFREWAKSGNTDVPLNPMSRTPMLSLRSFETISVPKGTKDAGAVAMSNGAELSEDGRSMRVPKKNVSRVRKALGVEEQQSEKRKQPSVPAVPVGKAGKRVPRHKQGKRSKPGRADDGRGRTENVRGGDRPAKAWSHRPVQPDAVSVVGIHYSNTEGLSALDGRKYSSNHKGGEFARVMEGPKAVRNRVYFYPLGTELSVNGESIVGRAGVYHVRLDNLYDTNADPRGLIAQVDKPGMSDADFYNALEARIIAEGFDGDIVRKSQMIVVLNTPPIPVAPGRPDEDGPLFSLAPGEAAAKNAPDQPGKLDVLDGMYSALYDTIANRPDLPRKPMPAAEWKRILTNAQTKGYFKKEEFDWIGLDEHLSAFDSYRDAGIIGKWGVLEDGILVSSLWFNSEEEAKAHYNRPSYPEDMRAKDSIGQLTDKVSPGQLLAFIARSTPVMEEVVLGENSEVDDEVVHEIRMELAQRQADSDMDEWAEHESPYSFYNGVTIEKYEDDSEEGDSYYVLLDGDGDEIGGGWEFESESEANEKLTELQENGELIGGETEERFRPAEMWRIEDNYGNSLGDGYSSEDSAESARQEMHDEWVEENEERAREQAWESAYENIDEDDIDRELERRGESRGSATQYSGYTTPGADGDESYRELLLKFDARKLPGGYSYRSGHFGQGGHGNNLMLHVRYDDRKTVAGEKVDDQPRDIAHTLYVEEIQSDWHQAGREKGYKGDVEQAAIEAADRAMREAQQATRVAADVYAEKKAKLVSLMSDAGLPPDDGRYAANNLMRLARGEILQRDLPRMVFEEIEPFLTNEQIMAAANEMAAADAEVERTGNAAHEAAQALDQAKQTNAVADAPFKKSWEELGFKQALRFAVEQGYDAIAWTTGAHHVARYAHALNQVIDRIAYTPLDPGLATDSYIHAVTAYQGGSQKFSDIFNAEGMSQMMHTVQHGQPMQHIHLREIVGQERAEEILRGDHAAQKTKTAYMVTLSLPMWDVVYRAAEDGPLLYADRNSKEKAARQVEYYKSHGYFDVAIVPSTPFEQVFKVYSKEDIEAAKVSAPPEAEITFSEVQENVPTEWKSSEVIGGKGFKAAYDIRLPNFVRKYVKKWGGDVQAGRIVGQDSDFSGEPDLLRNVHVVKITEEMRKSVNESGQPAWSLKKPGAKRMTAVEVKAHVAALTAKWSAAPKVNVVQGIAHLPARFRAALQSVGRDAMPEGFYDPQTGETWLIADSLTDLAAVERVLFEERLGHHGLRTTFKGEAFNKLLDGVFKSIESKPEAAEIAELYRSAYGASSATEFNRRVAEEYLAKLSPDQDQSVWQMFVAFVRDWLRKHNFVRTYTDNDLRNLMARIHDNVRFGHTSRSQAAIGPAVLSLTEDGKTETSKRSVRHVGRVREVKTDTFAATIESAYDEAQLLGVSELAASDRGLRDLARMAREEGNKGMLFAPGTIDAKRAARLGNVTESDGFVQVRFSNDSRPETAPVFSMRHRAHGSPEVEQILSKTVQPSDHDMTFWGRMQAKLAELKETNLSDHMQQLKVGWLDSAAQIEAWERGQNNGLLLDASQSAYKMISLTRNLPQVMGAIARSGVPRFEGGAFVPVAGRQGLYDIFRPLYDTSDGRNLTYLWEGYAVARRSNQLIQQKNTDGTSKEKLLSQAEIDKMLALEKQYPFFRDVFDRWQTFNREMLDLAVDRGAMTAEDAAMWKSNDYVPFYRAIEEAESTPTGPTRKRGLSDQAVRSKRLEGSDHRIQPLLENIVLNTASIVDKIYKNEAMNRIAALGTSLGFMEEVPLRDEAVKLTNDQLVRTLGKAGFFAGQMYSERARAINRALWNADFDDPSSRGYALGLRIVEAMTDEQREQFHTFFRKVKPVGHNIVSALVGGKPVFYEVKDPLALRAIADMGFTDFGKLIDLMGGAKHLLTTMVTADPGFMIANLMRDTLSAWVTSSSNFMPLSTAITDAREIWTQTGLAEQMGFAGGTGANFYNPVQDIRGVMRQVTPTGTIVARGARASWRAYRKIGAISEQLNRMAIARAVLAKGGSIAEASYQAQDILNFSQHGDSVAAQLLIRTVPFMNARLQGLYRLYKGATGRDSEDPGKARMVFLLKAAAITMASLLLALKNAGDDRYEKIPDDQKDTYWHFFIGDQHIAIPKPFEVGVLAATIPERLVRKGMGLDGWKELRESLLRAAGDTLAFNPIPQAAKPIIEQWANRSFFTGQPIVDLNMQGLLPEAQYNPWTSETARAVAGAMPDFMPEAMRSPVRIEATVRGYFGTIGAALLKMGDAAARSVGAFPSAPEPRLSGVPLVDQALARFVRGDPELESRNKYADDLYDALEKADDTYRTVNAYMRQGRMEEAQALAGERQDYLMVRSMLHSAGEGLSAFNQQQRFVLVSDMTPEEKRARIDEITRARNDMLKQISPYLGLID